ncbi:related to carboxylesterase [Fusarium mangiferae]|uniref:Carboxylic ester hydrolase n=1 Tax=Fusarium mangiferae TaxID=192010 RepID=A0A1L7TST2_FUSMA|nr:uncharacterized protein FMAN_08482 [Fusarium mangiferae]CVK98715.1 related to carboxylesterase [Fusarium mangiferae]
MSTVLKHHLLGSITGIKDQIVAQYRGIKYGKLENAFAEAVIFTNEERKDIDATEFGPPTISPPACGVEQAMMQQPLPYKDISPSLTDCLNLNITVPEIGKNSLPVFVFLHGGGYAIGANSWPQTDLVNFVKFSASQDSPIIGVSINYRLGAPGFLASDELTQAGCPTNRGLRDQQLAFGWVKKYISGFGGDPDDVTVIGSSAGGNAALLHLESSEPLFSRLISLAGTPLGLQPVPPEVADSTYQAVLKHLNINGSSAQERINALLLVPPQDLFQKIPPHLPLCPVVDGDVVKHFSTFKFWSVEAKDKLPGAKWCQSIMIGDAQNDASVLPSILGQRMENLVPSFVASVEEFFKDEPQFVEQLSKAYDIRDPDHQKATAAIMDFLGDLFFFAPPVEIADGFPGKKYVYRFNVPNPWDGPCKSTANHAFDVASFLLNYRAKLPKEQLDSSVIMATDFINFIHGREPYPEYTPGKGGIRVYGPPADIYSFEPSLDGDATGRRVHVLKLGLKIGLDRFTRWWHSFLASE